MVTGYNPWPHYKYTGNLRPYPYGPIRKIPKGMRGGSDGKGALIQRPDYADTGIPRSEMASKNISTIPVFLSNEEKEAIRTVCRVSFSYHLNYISGLSAVFLKHSFIA
jgi:methionyl aminopeptidase